MLDREESMSINQERHLEEGRASMSLRYTKQHPQETSRSLKDNIRIKLFRVHKILHISSGKDASEHTETPQKQLQSINQSIILNFIRTTTMTILFIGENSLIDRVYHDQWVQCMCELIDRYVRVTLVECKIVEK